MCCYRCCAGMCVYVYVYVYRMEKHVQVLFAAVEALECVVTDAAQVCVYLHILLCLKHKQQACMHTSIVQCMHTSIHACIQAYMHACMEEAARVLFCRLPAHTYIHT